MDAIYLRISKDRDGLEAGVERQREDTVASAKAAGVEISGAMIFQDNDISASPNSTKPRPEWDRLVELIEAGTVTRVWAWSTDRLTRRVRENEDIIDLHTTYGVEWETGSGTDDLSTSAGRASFRNKGVKASEEAERISERVTRQKQHRAAQGKPQGGRTRLYGYTSRWKAVPEEAEIIKEVFNRRASGESINSIALDLAARGETTAEFTCKFHTARFEVLGGDRPENVPEKGEDCTKCRPGRPWKTGTLLSTLRNPTYAGLRAYKKEIVGPMRDGWETIVSEATFNAAQEISVTMPKGTNTRRYLLSGFARCGKCLGRMVGGSTTRAGSRYRCSVSQGGCGGLSIKTDWVDDPVFMSVVAHEVAERHNNKDKKPEAALASNDAEIERIETDLRDLKAGVRDGTFKAITAMPMITELELDLSKAQTISTKAALVNAQDGWATHTVAEIVNLGLGEQRALLGKHLEMVRIDAVTNLGSKAMDLSRIELHYKDGTVERLNNEIPSHPLVNYVE